MIRPSLTSRLPAAFIPALLILVMTVLGLAGCAAPQATAVTEELAFDQAVNQATDGLSAQVLKLPAFLTAVESTIGRRGVVVDPMLDASTGQQTALTRQLEKRVSDRLATKEVFEPLAFKSANLGKAQYLLTGSTTTIDGRRNILKINLALTELKSGKVVAQSSAVARGEGLDASPTAYYRDSPVLLIDKITEGYLRTCTTAPGQPADAAYFERIATATVITEATALYNAERYQEALAQYKSAASTPAGEQLRVLNGIYLTNWKLGNMVEAERAFSKVVALGIANNTLGVKFLFNPGSTQFWSDPRISGPYAMWVRQIAKEASAAKVCMNIVGHTSRTGSEQANEQLSLQRATAIRQKLEAESGELGPRIKAAGKGFRENIVGSGTDDARDVLDRRVEFKIVGCQG